MNGLPKELFDKRPVIIAIAGPNGAGKSTFFETFIRASRLRFVNADVLALNIGIEAYVAAEVAARLRSELVSRGESFVFETVLSDPMGEKVAFLQRAAQAGYTVALCFIGLDSPKTSGERVEMRASQGGHDVPAEKLRERYPRTLRNLGRAIRTLPIVYVFDNSKFEEPFRLIAVYRDGMRVSKIEEWPRWFSRIA